MAKKKTPPEYGESDCSQSQHSDTISDHVIPDNRESEPIAAVPASGKEGTKIRLHLQVP